MSCAQCSDVADLKELLRTSLYNLEVPRPLKAPPKAATPPAKPPAKKRPSLVVD